MPLVPVAIFFVVLIVIGMVAAYRANRAVRFKQEFFLGSRSLGGIVLALTLVATYGSVSSFVSGPGLAWNLGLGWVVFAAPQIITAFLILGILGKRMTILTHRLDSLTIIDLIYERFKSRFLAFVLALMLVVFFFAMIVGQFIGGAQIFAGLTNIDYKIGLIIFALVTVLYSSGGFRAVALTDVVCAILMLSGMFIIGYIIISEAGGFSEIFNYLKTVNVDPETNISRNLQFDAGGNLHLTLLFSSWILVGFATIGLPQSLVRCMGYKSSKDLHKSMIIATIVCGALMIGMTMLGVLARGVIHDLPEGGTDRIIPTLIATKMHPLVAGLTILGPLAATMSTVSSLLISASSGIMRDLFKALIKAEAQTSAISQAKALTNEVNDTNDRAYTLSKHATGVSRQPSTLVITPYQKDNAEDESLIQSSLSKFLTYHEKLIVKGTTMVIGILGILIALFPPDIVVWINLFAFGGLESSFLWVIVLGLFSRHFNKTGAIAAVVGGVGSYTVLMITKLSLLSFHAIVPALAIGLICAIVGSFIGSKFFNDKLDLATHKVFFPHKPFIGKGSSTNINSSDNKPTTLQHTNALA